MLSRHEKEVIRRFLQEEYEIIDRTYPDWVDREMAKYPIDRMMKRLEKMKTKEDLR